MFVWRGVLSNDTRMMALTLFSQIVYRPHTDVREEFGVTAESVRQGYCEHMRQLLGPEWQTTSLLYASAQCRCAPRQLLCHSCEPTLETGFVVAHRFELAESLTIGSRTRGVNRVPCSP